MDYTYDITMFQDTFEHTFTYLNGFLRNTRRFADNYALFDPLAGKRWTYRTLNEDVNRLAHAFLRDGIKKNDLVLYMLLNSPEFIFCYLACHKTGAIGCPVNYRQAPGEIALMIDDSRPKVFFFDSEFSETAMAALEMASHKPEQIIMVDASGKAAVPEHAVCYPSYVADMSADNPPQPENTHIYDETTRLYTSGTTNRPKGVPLNSINEVLSSHDVIMHFPLAPTDRTMNMTPWFHRGGLHSGGPTPTLYVGAEVIVLREFNPRRCLEYVEKYDVTFLIGVPAILNMLSRAQEAAPSDLSSLRGIVTMGSPFEKAACEKFHWQLSPNIFNGYGTTESFWNTFLRPYDLPAMAGSAGRACTDDEVRVISLGTDKRVEPEDMVPQDGKTIGEIIISSPAKSTFSYFNNPEQTAAKFYRGFMYTGDLGVWDEKGFVTIAGRKDDMIVSAGENIFPAQVEAILNEHPKVAECGITGAPNPVREQDVTAYIVPSDDSLTIKELVQYCATHPMLSPYKRPKYYRLVKELPHTATGKLMHFQLKNMVLDDLENGRLRRL